MSDSHDSISVGFLPDGRVSVWARHAKDGATTELRMSPNSARKIAAMIIAAADQITSDPGAAHRKDG